MVLKSPTLTAPRRAAPSTPPERNVRLNRSRSPLQVSVLSPLKRSERFCQGMRWLGVCLSLFRFVQDGKKGHYLCQYLHDSNPCWKLHLIPKSLEKPWLAPKTSFFVKSKNYESRRFLWLHSPYKPGGLSPNDCHQVLVIHGFQQHVFTWLYSSWGWIINAVSLKTRDLDWKTNVTILSPKHFFSHFHEEKQDFKIQL